MTPRPILIAFASAAAGLILVGCGCTEIGCSSSLTVDLGALPEEAGGYTVSVEGDAERSCTFEIDEAIGLVDDRGEWDCFRGEPSTVVQFGIGEGDYLVRLSDEEGMELASASVSRGGWSTFSPNGKVCGPTCTSTLVAL